MSKKEKIVIAGGGGHAKVIIDMILSIGKYEIVGIIDPLLSVKSKVLNIKVLGDDSVFKGLHKKGVKLAALGIGSWGDNSVRGKVYEKIKKMGFSFPTLIHPGSYVSRYAKISDGVHVMAGACIQPNANIGENSVINTCAVVEHDCCLGNNVYLSSNSTLAGKVVVKDSAFIGAGTTVIPEITIGKKTLVAAGAVVIRGIKDGKKVKGVPAKYF